uniref:Acyl_transf_3 domain-containing protein n=1 Tax=Globodera pallida TaxID=36090 RepID=A0A183BU72_GLOPA
MKRADIQGLRTVAIFGVIIYHIWPTHFPSGFLGVDIFFVISGHLMAGCLAKLFGNCALKTDKAALNKLLQFYTRRIKRIVPIYIAIIYGTLSVSRTIMLDSDFQKARVDMYWALAFISNMQSVFENNDYFTEVFSYRPFLHCWSLGVEMHFYLLVPLAMFVLLSLRGAQRRLLRFGFCSIVLISSVTMQQLLTTALPALSFGFVFCRLWQFFAGILVHFLNVDEQDEADGGAQAAAPTGWPYVLGQNDKEIAISGNATALSAQTNANVAAMPCSTSPPPLPASSTASLMITSPTSSSSSSACQHETEANKNNLARFLWQTAIVHLLLLLLLCVLFIPFHVPVSVVPFQTSLVVILSAAQIHVHHQPGMAWPPSPLLSNFLAVQLGDLSYVWYLVSSNSNFANAMHQQISN